MLSPMSAASTPRQVPLPEALPKPNKYIHLDLYCLDTHLTNQ
jgi:hypothetical protein